jgi:hypothetical protein
MSVPRRPPSHSAEAGSTGDGDGAATGARRRSASVAAGLNMLVLGEAMRGGYGVVAVALMAILALLAAVQEPAEQGTATGIAAPRADGPWVPPVGRTQR